MVEKIYGPDIGTLKGKTTRRSPGPVRKDYIEIPPEIKANHGNLALCIDIMFVNGIPMMTGIDRSICYHSLVPLENQTEKEIYHGVDHMFRFFNHAGFTIRTIHCDGEFKKLLTLSVMNSELL